MRPDAARPLRRPHPVRRRWLLAGLAALLAAAGAAAAVLGLGGSGNPPAESSSANGSAAPAVHLSGVTSYDPYSNDHSEHDELAAAAADGDPSTYWTTSTYRYPNGGLGKQGVGVVVDAHRVLALGALTVSTDTPGFRAEILAGDDPSGPFALDSSPQQVNARTPFALRARTARYYVVWITNLGPHHAVHVNEVSAG